MIKKIYRFLGFIYFKYKFKKCTKNKNHIYIFDIDNTLADTWPSFNTKYKNHKERLKNLKSFENMISLVKKIYQQQNTVLFLTARDYRYYSLTKNWLIKEGVFYDNLIMVTDPHEKIKLLKYVSKHITIYDDMSYNHENGEVKYYDESISYLKDNNNIKYIDYEQIIKIQKGNKNG